MTETDYTNAWQEWDSLLSRRNRNPVTAMKEYLRREGWIVERPETLSLPVKVARSGSFSPDDGYKVRLHVRVNIGGRLSQVDYEIDAQNADMPIQSYASAISSEFTKSIMAELLPQISIRCEQEIEKAKREPTA